MKHLDHHFPHFNDAKMARFLRAFIIAFARWWGGGGGGRGMGIIASFYIVQGCRQDELHTVYISYYFCCQVLAINRVAQSLNRLIIDNQ